MTIATKKTCHSLPTIGLLGGIASGKSYVGAELQRLGCAMIDADKLGHEVLAKPAILTQLRTVFGNDIFTPAGSVDRKALAARVFGNTIQAQQQRRALESIVHPEIRKDAEHAIERLEQSDRPPLAIVIDAPLLIEAGWDQLCDYLFFVDTPDEVRRSRALQRGWSEQEWTSREAAQESLETKKRSATHFIPGDADPTALHLRLRAILEQVQRSSNG